LAEKILSSSKKTLCANFWPASIHLVSMGIAADHLTLHIDDGYSSWVFYNSDTCLNFDVFKLILYV
jgi:hypothetical protein